VGEKYQKSKLEIMAVIERKLPLN